MMIIVWMQDFNNCKKIAFCLEPKNFSLGGPDRTAVARVLRGKLIRTGFVFVNSGGFSKISLKGEIMGLLNFE